MFIKYLFLYLSDVKIVGCRRYICSYSILKRYEIYYHINVKFTCSNYFELELDFYYEKCLCTHFITYPRFKQTKSVNNKLSDHLFFYRLCIYYEVAQNFRVSLDEKRKSPLKLLRQKIL